MANISECGNCGKKRIEWIDLLRVFAIFGVILCHATESIYKLNIEYMSAICLPSKVFAFWAFTLGRLLGPPIFLMISGYLLLDREYDYDRTKRFWVNNWFHLLVCTEVWFMVYEVFLKFYMGYPIQLHHVWGGVIFMYKVNMSHVWYLPMILGMYVLVPFVANALQAYKVKNMIFPVSFFTVFAFGTPFLDVISRALWDKSPSLRMSMGFSGGTYGIYMVLGYMLKKELLKKVRTAFLALVLFLSFVAGGSLQMWAYAHGHPYNIWYDCPFILIASVAVFELFSRMPDVPAYDVAKWISDYSFAVYLIHNIVLNIVVNRISALACMRPAKVMLLWFTVTLLSLLCAWLVSKIPKVGRYILYMK